MSKKREQRVKQKKIAARQAKNQKKAPMKWDDLARAAFSQLEIYSKLHTLVEAAVNLNKEKAEEELVKRSVVGFYKTLNDHVEGITALLKVHSKTKLNPDGTTEFILLENEVRRPLLTNKDYTTVVDYKRGKVAKDDMMAVFDILNKYQEEMAGLPGLIELSNTVLELLGYVSEEDRAKLVEEVQDMTTAAQLRAAETNFQVESYKQLDAMSRVADAILQNIDKQEETKEEVVEVESEEVKDGE